MTMRRPYPSDLSDARWALIEPVLLAWRQARTDAGIGTRTPTHDLREIFNAIVYLNRTGIPWRYLPHDFPPHATVYHYFSAWNKDNLFTQLNYTLTKLARANAGRNPDPTAAIIDSQSVKTSTNAPEATQGFDAGKKIKGRKRHIITDVCGLLLTVMVTAAHISDTAAAIPALNQLATTHPTVKLTWADGGYKNHAIEHAAQQGISLHIVTKDPDQQGFPVLPRRWVIERTNGWLMFHRRLARDYETLPATAENMIRIAMIDNTLKQITDETTPTWRDT